MTEQGTIFQGPAGPMGSIGAPGQPGSKVR